VDEFDEQLSEALKRLAEPGDPAGVADSIRARMAAGGPGGPKPRRVPTGWRRIPRWALAVGAAVVVIGLVGGILLGLAPAGHPTTPISLSPQPSSVPAPSVSPTTTTTPTPGSTPTHHPAPPTSNPGGGPSTSPHHPARDTTSPMVGPTTVQLADYCSFAQGLSDTVNTHASDNVRVASVDISWAGTGTSGSGTMTATGHGGWTFSIPAANTQHQVTVTVTAHDEAGNSASDSTSYYDGCVVG
jgi:hypothetical protein